MLFIGLRGKNSGLLNNGVSIKGENDRMKFDCWMGEQCQLIVKMQKLKRIDIRNQEEVMAGIDILEA